MYDGLSTALGYLSIVAWLGAQMPQVSEPSAAPPPTAQPSSGQPVLQPRAPPGQAQ